MLETHNWTLWATDVLQRYTICIFLGKIHKSSDQERV